MKEIHKLDIKYLLEGQGSVGILSEEKGVDRYNCALSSLASAGTGRHQFCIFPLLASTSCPDPALSCSSALLNLVGSLTPGLPSPMAPVLLNLASELARALPSPMALPEQVGTSSLHRRCPLTSIWLWWSGGLHFWGLWD